MSVAPLRPVPRKTIRINKKVVIPLLVLVVLLGYVGITWLLRPKTPPVPLKSICELSHQKSRELFVDREYENLIEVNDYFAYGETLNLFNEVYELQTPDLFVGKTIVLVNLCDQNERVYMIERNVDGQLPLEDLPHGFYEIYIMHNLARHRLFAPQLMDERFTTIRRGEDTKQVRLLADAFLLENNRDGNPTFDRNYAFLEVSPIELDDQVFDIMIDPGHSNKDNGWLDLGLQANGLVEAEETYKMALALKAEFEKYNLKVGITRDEDEVVNTYNIDGRLHRGYQSQAKYYLEVQMVGNNNPEVYGTQIVYSSYASPKLPATLLKHLVENTNLQATNIKGTGNIAGVVPTIRVNGFDGNMVIRESGGQALAAATYSEKSKENEAFAFENKRGMQTISIEYIYITHPKSAQEWVKNYETYAKETVLGFMKYADVELDAAYDH